MSYKLCGFLHSFFDGTGYIAFLAVLTLIGHIFALDFFTMCIMLLSCAAALLILGSLLPIVSVMPIFIYQCSLKNSPSIPSFSDYYFTEWRGVVLTALFALVFLCAAYVFMRYNAPSFNEALALPAFLASLPLAAVLLLNGAFSGEWLPESLVFGFVQVISLIVLPYVFIFGLLGIQRDRLIRYFCASCAAIAAVLVIETAHLYLTGGVVTDGVASKELVLYGWGIWTTAGMDMAVLIPILFLGAVRGRFASLYLLLAHLCYGAAVLTLSRNALIFATLALIISAVVYIRFGMHGATYARICLIALGIALLFSPFYIPRLLVLLRDYIERGFSDNGRFALWKYGFESFLEAPVLGKGFFALETDTFRAENIFPPMLHNTLVQLAASCGALGILTYIVYRVRMLREFLRGIGTEGVFLLISMITLLLMSLFDNFVFHVQPMFVFSLCYAVGYLSSGAMRKIY